MCACASLSNYVAMGISYGIAVTTEITPNCNQLAS